MLPNETKSKDETFRYDDMTSTNGGNAAGMWLGSVVVVIAIVAGLLWYATGMNTLHESTNLNNGAATKPAAQQKAPYPDQQLQRDVRQNGG